MGGGGGQGGCERRIEVFVKIQKKKIGGWGGGRGCRVGGVGLGGGGGGVRVDVNEKLKFFRKLKKKIRGGVRGVGPGGVSGRGGAGLGGQGGCV